MAIIWFLVSYLIAGVVIELIEEAWLEKNSNELFGFELDPKYNGPIKCRLRYYNLEWFLGDVHDVLVWPLGAITLYRGIKIAQANQDLLEKWKKEIEDSD